MTCPNVVHPPGERYRMCVRDQIRMAETLTMARRLRSAETASCRAPIIAKKGGLAARRGQQAAPVGGEPPSPFPVLPKPK
jgi:hypothetical protein